jgi:4-hydroxymandelate oxidase
MKDTTKFSSVDRGLDVGRRNLLKASALLGAGTLSGQGTLAAQQSGQPPLTERDVLAKARDRLRPTCHVCPECNGVACAGDSGGIAGAGSGISFQNNFNALKRVKLVMRTVHEVTNADTSTTLFGQKISFPAVCAPMGPAATRFGKGISQEEWFDALVGGSVAAGTLGAVGDNLDYAIQDVKRNLEVIARYKGKSLYNSKPISNATITKWIPAIEATGAAFLSIDVDSGPKSAPELGELVRAFRIPVVVKGIMTLDDATRCADAGVAGIVISNHGGRRLDHTPGVAEVLPAIASKMDGKLVIFADGCVHTGVDVLKYLALGADVVMVGRHILRAAYGGGPKGVTLFLDNMRTDLARAMVLTGVSTVSKIDNSVISG